MRKNMLSLLALVAITTSFPVLAEDHEDGFYGHGKRSERAASVDVDKDGRVSMDEYKASRADKVEQHFKKVDTNSDGYIDGPEHAAAKGKWKERVAERRERMKERRAEKQQAQ